MNVTPEEIKEFIDSKEVLTQRELSTFMYGYNNGTGRNRFYEWWDYVLNTKDWTKLRAYREQRITTASQKKYFDQFLSIYNKDPRFKTAGKKKAFKLCKLHQLTISPSTVRRYLNESRKRRNS
jgi:hypothetical protein